MLYVFDSWMIGLACLWTYYDFVAGDYAKAAKETVGILIMLVVLVTIMKHDKYLNKI